MLSSRPDVGLIEIRRRTRSVDNGTEVVKKPKLVDDYHSHMGGVDVSDQLVCYYGYPHRSVKWWKRFFFHLLDLSAVNANILYNLEADKMTQLDFRVAVIGSLLEGHSFITQNRYYTPNKE